jgi:hypothetical protein
MRKRSAAEEKAIAHHEAGHIIIAYFLEIPPAKGEVTIVLHDESAGSFRSGVALSRLDLDWGNSDAVRTVVLCFGKGPLCNAYKDAAPSRRWWCSLSRSSHSRFPVVRAALLQPSASGHPMIHCACRSEGRSHPRRTGL